jgi:hypothetical protein
MLIADTNRVGPARAGAMVDSAAAQRGLPAALFDAVQSLPERMAWLLQ